MEITPRSWAAVVANALLTALVAFVSLLVKEFLDSREWDVPACLVDGACVGAGMLLVNVVLRVTRA